MKEVGEGLFDSPGTMVPAYQLDWDYPVWKLRCDTKTGLVAVECRDADTLQTAFSIFNANTGEVILRNYKPANAWWTSLAEIRAGLLYLQGVAAKGIGRPAGITAISIESGQVKWQRPEFSFYSLTATEILVLPAVGETAELTSLDPETGEKRGAGVNMAAVQAKPDFRQPDIQVPQRYPEESSYFADLKRFIFLKTNQVAHTAIDYLEDQKYMVLGFYPGTENKNQVYQLLLFTLGGECLLQEDLGKDLTGIGPDNFFIFQDTLILFKNKKSLLGYAV